MNLIKFKTGLLFHKMMVFFYVLVPEKSDLNEVIFEAGAILRQIVADFSSFVKQVWLYKVTICLGLIINLRS